MIQKEVMPFFFKMVAPTMEVEPILCISYSFKTSPGAGALVIDKEFALPTATPGLIHKLPL